MTIEVIATPSRSHCLVALIILRLFGQKNRSLSLCARVLAELKCHYISQCVSDTLGVCVICVRVVLRC